LKGLSPIPWSFKGYCSATKERGMPAFPTSTCQEFEFQFLIELFKAGLDERPEGLEVRKASMPPLVDEHKLEMTKLRKSNQILILSCVALFSLAVANGQTRGTNTSAEIVTSSDGKSPVRLRLVDSTTIYADEAWESEQGVWYRRGGMSHLLSRDRIKTIERDPGSQPNLNPQIAKIVVADEAEDTQDKSNPLAPGPVWIYLVGGARVEADNAVESTAGVWYRRGSLSIFIERVRIDHIERETLETVAESDSTSKKALGWTTGNSRIDSLIKQNGAKYGVDPYLIFCVMEQESHFNTRALSPKGAQGLMQLMPGTSARFGVRRPSDPAQNIAGGTRYLKQLMGQFAGRIDLVLAGYNAGEGAVMRFGGKVPPYRETRDYVKRISYRYRRTKPGNGGKNSLGAVAGF
jgi:Zn-finger nucleic acid-binding protein